ncbi:hypothetical protein H9L05_04080 [Hymenobacter qilianensis]|uniref:Uncharacterized protein n=1 Tax=Hymenobacter qilianensis TaxID=1385715 RepID=A0A7H0GX80_9BACT|nr:hypothetical protein [Hymenobacter qilianensis]QNP52896.1 hypothetical protein H9L05_04080 [Hymenobacter qilianensis]
MKNSVRLLRFAPYALLLLFLVAFAAPKPKLKKTLITKNLIVGIPEGFTALPDDGIATKYPAPRKPLAVFTNPSGRVDFSVAQKPSTFTSKDYGILLKIYKASIQNAYTKVDFLAEDIRTINKRDFVVLEFLSSVADTRRGAIWCPFVATSSCSTPLRATS